MPSAVHVCAAQMRSPGTEEHFAQAIPQEGTFGDLRLARMGNAALGDAGLRACKTDQLVTPWSFVGP